MIKKSLFSIILVPLSGLMLCSGCALNPLTSTASAPLPVQTVRYQDFQTTPQDPVALKSPKASTAASQQEAGDDVVERSQVVKQVKITGNTILAEH
ncbi:MAG: hypothetical protein P8J33_14780, partial [Pirellulaceae bacterium]|nr:hypothetical protein [Pirellulaceae bacterium]